MARRFAARSLSLFACAFLAGAVSQVGVSVAQETAVPSSAAEIKLSFAPVVKNVAPAVVNVYASRTVQQRQRSPFFDDPFFRRFFGDMGGGSAPNTRKRVQSSLGSGVIISADGTIITNHHVIADADEVRVALSDRREYDAEIVLRDERTDLAVLRIRDDEGNFPFVQFANSDDLEVGDLVLAIGNPFGVGQTVTQGIVSAVARTQVGVSDYQFFIQTDAAINPGNSGGALVDLKGRLVGINTAIFSRSGGSNGIGFAIPANMVEVVADASTSGDYVRRPWVGTSLQAVTSDIAEGLGLERPQGVLVTDVHPDSPAENAGLEVGDLILAVGEAQINDPDSFGYRLATQKLGAEASFTVSRGGEVFEIKVKLAAAPETTPRDERSIGGRSPFAGLTVLNLSPAVSEELRMGSVYEGVVVAQVERGSNAAYIGLRSGDVLLGVNGEVIEDTRDLEQLSKERPNVWRIEFLRDGRVRTIAVR
ncbi:DegQ family serine endoprotease [Rhodobacteraceae bacterium RKSG542]|uniref:DegQ family serine endoprotease n=1 Tax=Pseudovibrio flavus TaxID=2529854 RepID=UPI0012BC73AC|nr:DegQ family serine endoprotease [Pseudovibrio flavus]MTI16428.1 DegQ family serine endoprotease [Pseudovibrio flavus]